MKKAVCAIFLILAGTSVFAQNGVIKDITGQVELQAPDSSLFVAAKAGDRLTENTVVSTGFKSVALIEVGSAILTVRPLTRLTLTEIIISSETEIINVNLQTGRVRVDLNPPAGNKASMNVSSNVASSSARGTSFEFDTRNLQVNEGRVIFKGTIGQGAPVSAGSNVSVGQNGSAVNPVTYGTATLKPQSPSGNENQPPPPRPSVPKVSTNSAGGSKDISHGRGSKDIDHDSGSENISIDVEFFP